MSDARVLVLGGGLTGSIVACQLHDMGVQVAIVDKTGTAMAGASRWNEGKIHFGYTYVGTDSTRTSELMLAGAAVFLPIIERITGTTFDEQAFTRPITYLVDKASLFSPEVLWGRTQKVHALVRSTINRYPELVPKSGRQDCLRRVDPEEAAESTRQKNVAAAWTTPERALSARVLADKVAEAIQARNIELISGVVTEIARRSTTWRVVLASGESLRAGTVINALWESRGAMDAAIAATGPVSIRWKAAVFATGQSEFLDVEPSTRILGGYGDITPYANGDLFLSWYPSNMIARSDSGIAPVVPDFDKATMMERTLEGLQLPFDILKEVDPEVCVRGGFVVARGHGDIYLKTSPLHERSAAFAIELAPGYISVDAGKLTTAPLFAERAARLALKGLGMEVTA